MASKYKFDPSRIKYIDESITGEPPDEYHICDGLLDYYYDAKEHCFYYLDENDGSRHYTSAGFIETYSEKSMVTSCPICCACTHEDFIIYSLPNGGKTGKRECKLLNNPPKDVLEGRKFYCDTFSPDVNSDDYDLVMKLIKEHNTK